MMRWLIGASLMLAIGTIRAQVTMELRCQQEQYLLGEPVTVVAHISNQSGRAIELGGDESWLTFSVETKSGEPVAKAGKLPVPELFKVESAQIARVGLDLEPAFLLDKLGNYTVSAALKIPGWNQQVDSRPVSFTIIRGSVLWEQEFGMPADPLAAPTNRAPDTRKYTLLQANTARQLRLYVRLSDPVTERIHAMLPIGPRVSFGQPDVKVDRFSNLHLLHQNGARSYSYVVVSPTGRIGLREAYDITTTRPQLRGDADGKIAVQGGARRAPATDVPRIEAPPATNTVTLTNAPAAKKKKR